jgi:hypothetical protein
MAKTATDIPISQGSGVNLSNFALANGRRRQTVIIADADDSGEALCAELPAHDGVDRGSPLKIGGRASANPFAAVAEADRVDAWFTLQGQQTAVATIEPASIYDNGRQPVGAQLFTMTAAAGPIIGAVAGRKIKVLSLHVVCTNFTSAGQISVLNGSAGIPLMALWISALGNYPLPAPGYSIATTSTNTDLWWTFSGGAGNFAVTMTYYTAP